MFGENKLRKLYQRGPWLKTEDNKEIHINPEKINVKKSATSEYSKQMQGKITEFHNKEEQSTQQQYECRVSLVLGGNE